MNELLSYINSQYQMKLTKIKSINHSTYQALTQNNQKLAIKIRASQESLLKEVFLYSYLLDQGIPVPTVYYSMNGAVIPFHNEWISIYSWVDGSPIFHHTSYLHTNIFYKYGVWLSRLHKALASLEMPLSESNFLFQVEQWALPVFEKHFDKKQMQTFNQIRATWNSLEDNYHALPSQIIHRDFHPRNVLLKEEQLVSYLDFELSLMGVRIFDICYFLSAVLKESFTQLTSSQEWEEIFVQFLSGYQQSTPFTEVEIQSILPILETIQSLFLANYLGKHDNIQAEKHWHILNYLSHSKSFFSSTLPPKII
ncbi:hypothetical protein GCM10008967_33360 [Bacillus carboniphilus]|uniref:Aminoglycoside phosphotransferase domain-containing protein n=1 Tax=Bacillus carboniphilus TaxID=86663 RepID=A0ABN0WL47_9BACI